MSKKREVNINLKVILDDNNTPEQITWASDDPPSNGNYADAKAFFLSVFDEQQLETLQIDLWTQKFEVGEINRMVYYTIKGMADSYYRATKNNEISNDMARFAQYLGEELGIIKKSS